MLGNGGYSDEILYDDNDDDPRKADDEYYGQTFEVGRLYYNQSQIIPKSSLSASTTLTSDARIDVDIACNALTKADCNAYPLLRDEARNMYLTFVKNGLVGHRPRPVLTSIAVLLASRHPDLQHAVPAILYVDVVQFLGSVTGYKSMASYKKPATLIKISEQLYEGKEILHANLDALIERLLVRCCCWSRSCSGPELFEAAKRPLVTMGDELDELPESKRSGVVAAAVIDACKECHWKYKNNQQIMAEIGANRNMLYRYRKLLPAKETTVSGEACCSSSPSLSSPQTPPEENRKRRFSARGFGNKSLEKRRKAMSVESGLAALLEDGGTQDLTIDLDTVYITPDSSTIPTTAFAPPATTDADGGDGKLSFDMDDFFV